jgi:murein peptide amidase A
LLIFQRVRRYPVPVIVRLAGFLLLTIIGLGCGSSESRPEYIEPTTGYGGAIMGWSVEQRPIIVERFGRSGPVVFLFHTIHGNEVPAEQCGERMRSWLLSHPGSYQDMQLAYITQVNPDGYLAGTRFNANGIDLNRNFPATNFEPSDTYGPTAASEPETQVVVEVVEQTSPTVIVSVHSPLDVINYDGPAQELAESASLATGIPVDVDIGPYPGSFGSYAGLDLQIPTITLETPGSLPTRAEHIKWMQVEELAMEWVAEQGLTGGITLSDLVVDKDVADDYEAIGMGDSAGGRPLVAEQFGQEGRPVLVLAGLDGSDMSVLCAERFRARLMGERGQAVSQRKVLLMTVSNPDGLATSLPLNDDGLNPDKSFARGFIAGGDAGTEPFECDEAAAIRDLVEDHDVAALVVIQGSDEQLLVGLDGQSQAMLDAAADNLYSAYQPLESDRPGTLSAWAADLGIPALSIAIPDLPVGLDIMRADNLGLVLQSVVEAAP